MVELRLTVLRKRPLEPWMFVSKPKTVIDNSIFEGVLFNVGFLVLCLLHCIWLIHLELIKAFARQSLKIFASKFFFEEVELIFLVLDDCFDHICVKYCFHQSRVGCLSIANRLPTSLLEKLFELMYFSLLIISSVL